VSAAPRKWLKRIGSGVVVLIVLASTFAAWLLESESGARFALARAKAALEGNLDAAIAHGTLASPLELHDVRYRDAAAGIDMHVASMKVEYALSRLFSRTLHVAVLDIDGVDIALTTVTPTTPAAPPPSLQSLLTPPLTILLDRAHVGRLSVQQDGKPVFASDSLDLAATWTNTALAIRQLALRAPQGKVDLDGELTSYRDVRGTAKLAFDWKLPTQRIVGNADLHNDGALTTLAARLGQPLTATLDATLKSGDNTLPWKLAINVPAFDAGTLVHSDSIKTLALKLEGSGDRMRGNVAGNLDVNGHRVLFDPLQFSATDKVFIVDALRLRSPDAAGTLNAQARVQLDAQPVSAEATIDWNGVELPADLVGQPLATHGSLRVNGGADKYAAHGKLTVGPPDRLADIELELHGTPQAVALQQLALKQKNGGLDAHGEIALEPQPAWDLTAKATKLDPGAFAKQWTGAVDFDLSTKGKMDKAGPAGELQLHRLDGTLRQRTLSGDADLRFAPPFNLDGTLKLKSGNSSIALRGKGGEHTDVAVDLAVASLGDWLPQAGGSVQGNVAVQGAWPKLDARGQLDAHKIVFGDTRADAAHLDLDVRDISAPGGHLRIDGKTLSTAGHQFDTFALDAHGNRDAHALSADLHGPQLALAAALDGSLAANGRDWHGNLSALSLKAKEIPTLSLQHPAALRYAGGAFDLSELCLGAEASRLCASAAQDATGKVQAKFSIAHLPLTTIARVASPDAPLKLDGELAGDGELSRAADGTLGGHARLSSASGSIAYPDTANQPLLAYRNFDVDAALAPAQSIVKLRGELNDGGHVDGRVTLDANSGGAMPLAGDINAALGSLGFVDLLSDQVASTKGRLEAKFDLGGTTATPTLAGHLALAEFATEVPAAGIKLRDGRINVQSGDGRTFAIDGSIASDSGKLALSGSAGAAADAPLALKITGENFLAADIPGAQVRVSPDLALARNAGKFAVSGSVRIPRADIDLSKLPGSGAAATSPDVVIADAQTSPGPANTPLDADITVKFGAGEQLDMDLRQGHEVHLVGFGLNGYLGGQLAVSERPGRTATGRGDIVVNGTYKAYGQDLKIEQGRLLFAGTPVDNPGLDLRATRGFSDPDVTVGLQVRGTAQVPVLTVFSDPAMEQSDALSYLVAGKPLSQLKSGEGDAVGSAARALGTAGGDLLAKSIGTKMGLDDVGVADSSAIGGAALTVGKYLSPRLYLSYGVGLFTPGEVVTLRYRLTRLFNIEIQNGTLSSRAGINYKIEK
jgi:translocation and assembly module TamB